MPGIGRKLRRRNVNENGNDNGRTSLREWTRDDDPWDDGMLLADGLTVASGPRPAVAVYDRARCRAILQERDGMTAEEAEEWLLYRKVYCHIRYTGGAWVGPRTSLFLEREEWADDETG